MSEELRTKRTDELLSRLDIIEAELNTDPAVSELIDAVHRRTVVLLREIGLIQVELARRIGTGWQPL